MSAPDQFVPAVRPGHRRAVAAGRAALVAGQRVDMGAVAATIEVSRATVHRWFGTRDRLLGEVLWSLCEDTFARATAEASGRGRGRVLDVLGRFCGYLVSFEPFRAFLTAEPEAAARVLTTPQGDVERRVTALIAALLDEECARGLELREPTATLAPAIVRVGEAFLYADVLAGTTPDVSRALAVFELLLVTS